MKYTQQDYLKIKAMREGKFDGKIWPWKEIAEHFKSPIGSVAGVLSQGNKGIYLKHEPSPAQQILSPPQEQPAANPPAPAPGPALEVMKDSAINFSDVEKMQKPPTLVIGGDAPAAPGAAPSLHVGAMPSDEKMAVAAAMSDSLMLFQDMLLDNFIKKPLTEKEKAALGPSLQKVLYYYMPDKTDPKATALFALLIVEGGIFASRSTEIKALMDKKKNTSEGSPQQPNSTTA